MKRAPVGSSDWCAQRAGGGDCGDPGVLLSSGFLVGRQKWRLCGQGQLCPEAHRHRPQAPPS